MLPSLQIVANGIFTTQSRFDFVRNNVALFVIMLRCHVAIFQSLQTDDFILFCVLSFLGGCCVLHNTCICICMYIFMYIHIHCAFIYIFFFGGGCVLLNTCIYIYVYMYIYIYVYMYIYIYIY